jgi:hypothetical protein
MLIRSSYGTHAYALISHEPLSTQYELQSLPYVETVRHGYCYLKRKIRADSVIDVLKCRLGKNTTIYKD